MVKCSKLSTMVGRVGSAAGRSFGRLLRRRGQRVTPSCMDTTLLSTTTDLGVFATRLLQQRTQAGDLGAGLVAGRRGQRGADFVGNLHSRRRHPLKQNAPLKPLQ